MDFVLIFIGIFFMSVGLCSFVFTSRFLKHGAERLFDNNRDHGIAGFPPFVEKTSTITKEEFVVEVTKHWFSRLWLVLIRILSIMFVVGGFFALLGGLDILT